MKINKKLKPEEKIEEEFLKARKSFQKIQKEISPFIRKRKAKSTSTADKWCESSICQFGT